MEKARVCGIDELSIGAPREVQINGETIVLCRTAEGVFAVHGICPHRGAQLAQGTLEGTVLVCPWHEWAFDCVTGKGLTNPMSRLCRFDVEIVGPDVFVSELAGGNGAE